MERRKLVSNAFQDVPFTPVRVNNLSGVTNSTVRIDFLSILRILENLIAYFDMNGEDYNTFISGSTVEENAKYCSERKTFPCFPLQLAGK